MHRFGLGIGLALGLLGSANAREVGYRHFRSLLEIRQHNVVVQKWELSCGAAALATLLNYQQADPVTEKAVAEGMLRRTTPLKVKYKGGFSWLDLKHYAEDRGYKATGYGDLDLNDLDSYAPLIVPIRNPASHHFVVVRGVKGDRVVLADPGWGNRTLSRNQFEAVWIDHLGFTVSRKDGRQAPNQLAVRGQDAFLLPSDKAAD